MAHAHRKRNREPESIPAPRPDWLVLMPAAAGMIVAGYLAWLKLTGAGVALCAAGSGCDIVQASRYAMFLWVPTALWGFAVYAAIGVLAGLGVEGRNWLIAFLLAAGGAGFSLYLTALSVVALGAACVWCLTSNVIMLLVFAALLWRRPAAVGRRSPFRPVRLATWGGLSAVGAVVAGGFIFAAPFSAAPDYQTALARHLTEIKAVMYGVYW